MTLSQHLNLKVNCFFEPDEYGFRMGAICKAEEEPSVVGLWWLPLQYSLATQGQGAAPPQAKQDRRSWLHCPPPWAFVPIYHPGHLPATPRPESVNTALSFLLLFPLILEPFFIPNYPVPSPMGAQALGGKRLLSSFWEKADVEGQR